mmetsp:Transcript_43368/g.92852  ORF Transcript_43368/g.92852 Transcript_43368/m.92852 type:complete len:534 (-) Transcript_43368:244-1845(-)|eukprot:CAMPEP_0206470220 /NCGR_PEP_ID=MMETSP0324_2-20121206/30790_1 /ASSEMBLY_ACC=CAM_ASM_000836 /TAXON_ID=2866 /ORGANISM="Crypthecodinium cohnii, Strain Seligo" /LENGTH=533 /DNA_ID=CAMNT_0053944217 /DNA_START=58 /DNA_END=1659 /DNA_ORIENTATION=+
MALAWATSGGGGSSSSTSKASTSPLAALLASGSSAAAASSTDTGADAAKPAGSSLPEGFILIMTQVLPDGFGDLIFGENAVQELQEIGPVIWLRCYVSKDNFVSGEELISEVAAKLPRSYAWAADDDLDSVLGSSDSLLRLWAECRECFLAPWIFGLSGHEEAVLTAAKANSKRFWALTEYGRGMGNIHTYTFGLGAKVPTGWTLDPEEGGVFRSILRLTPGTTDWKAKCAQYCQLPPSVAKSGRLRLWWFYSRKDDEKKHDFRILDHTSRLLKAAKVIPVGTDGEIITDPNEKTNGEKLAEQLLQAANNPDFKPNTDVSCAEATSGCAGQLSQFIWGILLNPAFNPQQQRGEKGEEEPIDIVVAPNLLSSYRKANGGDHAAAEILNLELLLPGVGSQDRALPPGRRLFVCSCLIPRADMRTFLEQTERLVYTTGDQSLSEAMFLDKIPVVKPDAKVTQWQLALNAKLQGLSKVPDLGRVMRDLVTVEATRSRMREASEVFSKALELQMVASLGPVESWTPTNIIMARAGMMG